MKLVISDPKTGKAFNKKTEKPVFVNRKIGEEVELASAGLPGFKAKIAGGSDKQGFPMKPTLDGQARKKILLRKGVGTNPKRKGQVNRKNVRGNTVSPEIVQLNLKVTQQGKKPLEETLTGKGEKKGKEKESAKERMVRKSLESVGDTEAAEAAKALQKKK